MTRTRLRNKFSKGISSFNRANYNKQHNFFVKLLRNNKRNHYNNFDLKLITDNKLLWKTIKPLFSDKTKACTKITRVEKASIISGDNEIAETINNLFSDVIAKLEIKILQKLFDTEMVLDNSRDKVEHALIKFKKNPSVIKIKEKIQANDKFHLKNCSLGEIVTTINELNKKKPTTFENVPAKIIY